MILNIAMIIRLIHPYFVVYYQAIKKNTTKHFLFLPNKKMTV